MPKMNRTRATSASLVRLEIVRAPQFSMTPPCRLSGPQAQAIKAKRGFAQSSIKPGAGTHRSSLLESHVDICGGSPTDCRAARSSSIAGVIVLLFSLALDAIGALAERLERSAADAPLVHRRFWSRDRRFVFLRSARPPDSAAAPGRWRFWSACGGWFEGDGSLREPSPFSGSSQSTRTS